MPTTHKYYTENKEEINRKTREYYQLHKDELRMRAREKARAHKEEKRLYSSEYRKKNPEKVLAYNQSYRVEHKDRVAESSRKSREKHKDKRIARQRKYKTENKEKFAVYESNRRARIKGSGGKVTVKEWVDLKNYYGNICLCCLENKELTIDHVLPLSLGGEHSIRNIQPLCGTCNYRKHAKHIDYRILFNE